jgi:hypothetical protein
MLGHIDYLNLLPFYQFLKKKGIKVTKKGSPSRNSVNTNRSFKESRSLNRRKRDLKRISVIPQSTLPQYRSCICAIRR